MWAPTDDGWINLDYVTRIERHTKTTTGNWAWKATMVDGRAYDINSEFVIEEKKLGAFLGTPPPDAA